MAGSCGHGNEPPGAIKFEEFLGYLSDYQLKKDFMFCNNFVCVGAHGFNLLKIKLAVNIHCIVSDVISLCISLNIHSVEINA